MCICVCLCIYACVKTSVYEYYALQAHTYIIHMVTFPTPHEWNNKKKPGKILMRNTMVLLSSSHSFATGKQKILWRLTHH